MVARSISLKNIVDDYNIADETILNIFYAVLNNQNISIYNDKLEQLFIFAMERKELFTNIRVTVDQPSNGIAYEYIEKLVCAYIKD